MAMKPAFVKFSRGLLDLYNSLQYKDPNTLYLVYDKDDSKDGLLYLGDKLISSAKTLTSKLSDLIDVDVSNASEGMLLQYNGTTQDGVWEAVSLPEVMQSYQPENNISLAENLDSIENPSVKDIAIIGSDAYIYDGSKWVQLSDSNLTNRISNLEDLVGHKAQGEIPATGLYEEIANLRSDIMSELAENNHLTYEIVSSLESLESRDDTENIVFLVPNDPNGENDIYDEYFVIDGKLEKIGTWTADLANYVKNDDDRLLDSDQKKKLEVLELDEQDNVTIQAVHVGGLTQAIQDNQLIKRVDTGTFNVTTDGTLQLKSVPSIDLKDYVKTVDFNAAVGDLTKINNRVKEDSSLVDEINEIKTSIIWQELQELAANANG